jgi:endo-1,4-beta-xylanase
MDWPTLAAEDSTISAFSALGIRVNITELDVDVLPAAVRGQGADVATRASTTAAQNPYVAGLPDSVQQALAARYEGLFDVFMRHRAVIDRITFWGVADRDSWLNNWPVRGRTSYPLVFDRQHRPKPAFDGVVRAARTARVPAS